MAHLKNVDNETYWKGKEIAKKENREFDEVIVELGGVFDYGELEVK
jgi:hypothetical protein